MFGDGETSILDEFDYFSDDSNKENVPGPSNADGSSESMLESTPKKRKVENTCKTLVPVKRFKKTSTEDKMKEYSKGYTSANTKANTEWVLRNFKDWCTWRQNESSTDLVLFNLLSSNDADELNKWLSAYVMEIRKKNGDRFLLFLFESSAMWPPTAYEKD